MAASAYAFSVMQETSVIKNRCATKLGEKSHSQSLWWRESVCFVQKCSINAELTESWERNMWFQSLELVLCDTKHFYALLTLRNALLNIHFPVQV